MSTLREEAPSYSQKVCVTRPELRDAVSTGNLKGVPRVLDSINVFETRPSLNLRINMRGELGEGRGIFGDSIIGAQSVETNTPVITSDRRFADMLRMYGGTVRYFVP